MLLLCHSTSSLSWRTGEPENWRKVNVIQLGQEGGPRKLQASQPHLYPWKGDNNTF